ncbi:MAG TPA: hypothetical protein VGN07_04885 [Steroidobacteraceae bacterium]
MEENTSKVYVEPAAHPLGAQLAAANGAGSALFVINLCASMAPVPLAGKTLPGLDNYRVYQVSRVEDGRTRYRLRLGFFPSEADAETVLAGVREKYPTAFTACLCEEDRKFARGYVSAAPSLDDTQRQKRPVALVPVAAAPTATAVDPSKSAAPIRAPAKTSAPEKTVQPAVVAIKPAAPIATSATHSPKVSAPQATEIELSWEPEIAARVAESMRVAPAPAVKDASEIELSWESPSLPQKLANEPTRSTLAIPVATSVAAPVAAVSAPIELTLESTVEPRAEVTQAKPSDAPFHVGKGVDIPAISLSLAAEADAPATNAARPEVPASKPAIKAPPAAAKEMPKRNGLAAVNKPAAPTPATRIASAVANTPPLHRTAQPAHPPGMSAFAAELDSTQTIRALTSAELNDASQEKWFAIQLAVSEQPVNLDAMPHLDIFEAYRLYSVASAGSGKIVHSLRLGFFREAVSAEAVGGYLKTFFPNPSVLRISTAEQTRFKDAPAHKPAAADTKNEAKVLDLSDARLRSNKPVVPTVTMEVATPRAGMPGGSMSRDSSSTGTHKISASGSYKIGATGTHKLNATGTHKLEATGTHKLAASGPHKISATGTHRALKPAAKNAAPASKHSAPLKGSKTSASGKFRAMGKKSLHDQLLDEAREVALSESGIRKLPKNDSLLARLVDKLKK